MNSSTPKKYTFQSFYPIILFCFSFLLYSQSINFKYTMFDDDALLMMNKDYFTKDGSLSKIFTTDAYMRNDMTFYRPLQNFSFLIDVKISAGMNTSMFHFSSVLLFSLIASTLYFLLLRFQISPLYAFLGTLFYAAHPLFASSAAWLPARGDLLLTLFSLWCFIYWIRFLNDKKYGNLLLTWLCFALALFTKETAALLPVLFLLYFLFFNSNKKIDLKIVLLGSLFLCTALSWFFLRALSIVDSNTSVTFFEFLRSFLSIPASLALFAIPYDFSTVPAITLTKGILGSVLFIALILLIIKPTSLSLKTKIFFFLWYLLLLFPTFFSKSKEVDYLEHRFLLPLIGILIIVLLHIPEKFKTKITYLTLFIVIVFSTVTVFKTQVFANPVAFCEAAKYNTKKPEVHYFLKGNIAQISDNFDEALLSYNTAIHLNPNHTKALNNRGIIKQAKNDFMGALVDFNRAIELDFKNYYIYKNRGMVKMQLGDFEGAIEDFGSALEFENQVEIYFHRGNAFLLLEEDDNALNDFNRYFTKEKANPEFYTKLGIDFGKKSKLEQSIICFTKAIEIDSTYTLAYYNRAFAMYIVLDYAKALADCEKLLTLDPQNKNAQILKEQCTKKIVSSK